VRDRAGCEWAECDIVRAVSGAVYDIVRAVSGAVCDIGRAVSGLSVT